jgi:hypothetical protein
MFNKNEDEDQWENDSAVSESSDSTDDSSWYTMQINKISYKWLVL